MRPAFRQRAGTHHHFEGLAIFASWTAAFGLAGADVGLVAGVRASSLWALRETKESDDNSGRRPRPPPSR